MRGNVGVERINLVQCRHDVRGALTVRRSYAYARQKPHGTNCGQCATCCLESTTHVAPAVEIIIERHREAFNDERNMRHLFLLCVVAFGLSLSSTDAFPADDTAMPSRVTSATLAQVGGPGPGSNLIDVGGGTFSLPSANAVPADDTSVTGRWVEVAPPLPRPELARLTTPVQTNPKPETLIENARHQEDAKKVTPREPAGSSI